MTFIGTPKTKISQWPITSLCITQLFPEKFRVAKAKISAAKKIFCCQKYLSDWQGREEEAAPVKLSVCRVNSGKWR